MGVCRDVCRGGACVGDGDCVEFQAANAGGNHESVNPGRETSGTYAVNMGIRRSSDVGKGSFRNGRSDSNTTKSFANIQKAMSSKEYSSGLYKLRSSDKLNILSNNTRDYSFNKRLVTYNNPLNSSSGDEIGHGFFCKCYGINVGSNLKRKGTVQEYENFENVGQEWIRLKHEDDFHKRCHDYNYE